MTKTSHYAGTSRAIAKRPYPISAWRGDNSGRGGDDLSGRAGKGKESDIL